MMLSLLWYYRPEHLDRPNPEDLPDEVYASRHRDTTSVACVEDRCYVMTFNEYCRWVTLLLHLIVTDRFLSLHIQIILP